MLEVIQTLYPLPFKFLDSYAKEDVNIYFGRQEETEALFQKVTDNKITLIYGASGTGKTSLVNCGMAAMIFDYEWVPIHIRRGNNIIESTAAAINGINETNSKTETIQKPEQFKNAISSLISDQFKPIYFIFDQFEEVFIFGNKEERLAFAEIIKELAESHLSLKFLFVMREEYLAGITELEQIIPDFFANRLRIERMTLANARKAIEGPCELYNIKLEDGVADEMLFRLNQGSNEIDLTYLQVYLDRIYRLALDENDGKNLVFHKGLLDKAGNVPDLLGSFLNEQLELMPDQEKAVSVLKSFVTAKGTKRRMNCTTIISYLNQSGIQMDENELKELLQVLIGRRILTEKDNDNHYELRHDALAEKIFEKISLVEKELMQVKQLIDNAYERYQKRGSLLNTDDLDYIAPYESRLFLPEKQKMFINRSRKHFATSKRRKRHLVIAGLSVLVVLLSSLSWWAIIEKQKAEQNENMHRASFFNALANEVEKSDPTKALKIAEYAYGLHPSSQIANNIQRIYSTNTFYQNICLNLNSENQITAYALSADQKILVTGHGRGQLNIWNTNGDLILTLKGHQHTNSVTSLAFSPCGDFLVSNAMDGMMILWDIEGAMQKIIEQPTMVDHQVRIDFSAQNVFTRAAFSPDGKIIAAIDRLNGQLRLYDHNGNKKKNLLVSDIAFFDFLPGSKTIVSATSAGKIQFWDTSLKETGSFSTGRSISALKACPLGNHVALAIDKNLYLYGFDGSLVTEFIGHRGDVLYIDFSADGAYITSSSTDLTSRLWHRSGILAETLQSHEDLVGSVILNGGNTVMTGSLSGFKLHQISGKLHAVVELPQINENYNHFLKFSDNGSHFLYIIEDLAYVFNKQGELISSIKKKHQETDHINHLVRINISIGCFSACGDYVFLSFGDETARMYDLEGNLVKQFAGHKAGSYIGAMAVSPDGKYLLTGGRDEFVIIWDMEAKILQRIQHINPIVSLAVSNGSRYFVASTNDGNISLWTIDGELINRFLRNQRELATHLAFSKDDEYIHSFSGSSKRVSRFFPGTGTSHLIADGGEGDFLLTIHKLDGTITNNTNLKRDFAKHYAFSKDYELALVGFNNTNAQLLDQSGQVLQNLDGHRNNVQGVAISPDGQQMVVADHGRLYLWERKLPYDIFFETGNYEALSISDKLHYGILDFNDALKQLEWEDMHLAALYYYEASDRLNHDERLQYLDHAFVLLRKLIRNEKRPDYIYNQLGVIKHLQQFTHSENHEREAERLVRELEKHNSANALKHTAEHFVQSARRLYGYPDLNIKNYYRAMHFYEMLLETHPETPAKASLMQVLNALSLTLIYAGEYAQSLEIANKGFGFNPDDETINSRLMLALLFNDMIDEAVDLFSDSRDAWNDRVKRQVIIHLNRLQKAGMGLTDHDEVVQDILAQVSQR